MGLTVQLAQRVSKGRPEVQEQMAPTVLMVQPAHKVRKVYRAQQV